MGLLGAAGGLLLQEDDREEVGERGGGGDVEYCNLVTRQNPERKEQSSSSEQMI